MSMIENNHLMMDQSILGKEVWIAPREDDEKYEHGIIRGWYAGEWEVVIIVENIDLGKFEEVSVSKIHVRNK